VKTSFLKCLKRTFFQTLFQKLKERQILPGSMHELKNVKLKQEQDFNRENHIAQIFSHLVMPGEISKDQPDFPTFCQKAP
jgi:hypothetical protein